MDVVAEAVATDVVGETEAANLTAEDGAADDVAAATAVAAANTGGLLGAQKGPVINQVPSHTSRVWRGERRQWVAMGGERWWQPLPPANHDSSPAGGPFATKAFLHEKGCGPSCHQCCRAFPPPCGRTRQNLQLYMHLLRFSQWCSSWYAGGGAGAASFFVNVRQ